MENIYLSGTWGFVTRHLYAVVAHTSGSFKASACRKPLSKQQSQSPFHLCLENPVTHILLHHTQQHYTNSKHKRYTYNVAWMRIRAIYSEVRCGYRPKWCLSVRESHTLGVESDLGLQCIFLACYQLEYEL